jgi:ArsR family transcriptional regulator, arsenate/arsenite/antimonite-responsive transcriptional repressor
MVFLRMAKKVAASPASLFRTLADPTRLRILRLIGESEVCVCYFVEALQLSQPKISRHLAYLRRSGIVHARKDGKWVRYSIAFPPNPSAAAILREALAWTSEMPETKRDRVRFSAACCQPQRFISLRGAPPPSPASDFRGVNGRVKGDPVPAQGSVAEEAAHKRGGDESPAATGANDHGG